MREVEVGDTDTTNEEVKKTLHSLKPEANDISMTAFWAATSGIQHAAFTLIDIGWTSLPSSISRPH